MFGSLRRVASSFAAGFLACASGVLADGAAGSSWVRRSATGNLLYATDDQGVRILDYSGTGYKGGAAALPEVARQVPESRWIRLLPQGSGRDDTAAINEQLSRAGSWEPINGWRGVVFLGPGEYRLEGTLRITNSGVVLKGSGSSGDSATRLRATADHQYTLIEIAGAGQLSIVPGSEHRLVEKLVPAGTRTFRVDRTDGLKRGDPVLVIRPTTDGWIDSMDMDRLVHAWFMNYDVKDLWIQRTITRVERGWITVDEPLPQTIHRLFGGGSISLYSWPERIENIGVEDLDCVSDYAPSSQYAPPDEQHAWKAIEIINAQDVWVRNVAGEHFGFGTVSILKAKRVTVAESRNLRPVSPITGGYRYSFSLDLGELVLVRDCDSDQGRHDYVLAALTPGPNAFVRSRAKNALDESGPHHRWSVGALFDNVTVDDNELNVSNRGNSGGGHNAHGWTGGYMTVWNSSADDGFRVRNPPTARNWLIGGDGEIKGSRHGCWCGFLCWWLTCWAVGRDPEGTYELSGDEHRHVTPYSLYFAQRQQRLRWPGSEFREYRLGDIDQFTADFGPADQAPVNPNWLRRVQSSGATAVSSRFDEPPSPSSRVAFTFNFALGQNHRVRAASLMLWLSAGSPSADHRLYLDSLRSSIDLNLDLGPFQIWTPQHTVEVSPEILQDGRLNVALSPDISVDFAVLNLQVSREETYDVLALTPEADSHVRAGDSASQNFGGESELEVKNEGSGSNFTRRALVGWSLAGGSQWPRAALADAKVRLYCTAAGQRGNEQSAAVLAGSDWSEGAVTWNNQPDSRPPIAYWVPVPGEFAEFTVTQEVAAALAGDRRFSLRIEAARDWGNEGWVRYASREDPDPAHRPQLLLRFSRPRRVR